jgi:hypothetical protein
MSRAFERISRRVAACTLLFTLLCGPTPGAVGSCGSDELAREADLESYCAQREQLVCVRQSLRREITIVERDECRRQAIMDCHNRSWAPRCQPTERQTQACLNALSSTDTLNTPEDELEECQTKALCTAEPRGDAGIEAP